MEDGVEGARDFDVARDILMREAKFRMREEMGYVGVAAGYEIVEAENFPAFF
jgi:hypothetical protein